MASIDDLHYLIQKIKFFRNGFEGFYAGFILYTKRQLDFFSYTAGITKLLKIYF